MNTTLDPATIGQRIVALETLLADQDREFAALEATLKAAIERPEQTRAVVAPRAAFQRAAPHRAAA